MDERLALAITRLEHMLGKQIGNAPKEFVEDVLIVIKAARASEELKIKDNEAAGCIASSNDGVDLNSNVDKIDILNRGEI